jgi:fructose-1,6-bisphosphatase/inositol monophosphatase family enzyme
MRVVHSRSFGSDDLESWLVVEGRAYDFVTALDKADRKALIELLRQAMRHAVVDDGGQAAAVLADLYLSDPSLLPQAVRGAARR